MIKKNESEMWALSAAVKSIFFCMMKKTEYMEKILLFNELPLSFSFEVANEVEVNSFHLFSKVNSSS